MELTCKAINYWAHTAPLKLLGRQIECTPPRARNRMSVNLCIAILKQARLEEHKYIETCQFKKASTMSQTSMAAAVVIGERMHKPETSDSIRFRCIILGSILVVLSSCRRQHCSQARSRLGWPEWVCLTMATARLIVALTFRGGRDWSEPNCIQRQPNGRTWARTPTSQQWLE